MLKTILLVIDDEEDVLELIKETLMERIDEVHAFTSAEEGLDYFNTSKVTCILSDLKMPGMDGMGFIKQIREIDKTVPFIFLSGYGSVQNQANALKYGAYEFLDKTEFDEISSVVERAVDEYMVKTNDINDSKQDNDTECMNSLEGLLRKKRGA